MAQPTFEIKDLDRIVAAFAGAPKVIEAEVGVATEAVLGKAAALLAQEPPPPSGSRYIRSHRLSSGWQNQKPRFIVAGNSKSAVLKNQEPYVRWVQSRADQARVHVGRWPTVEQVQEDLAPVAESELEAAGVRALNKIAGAL